MKKLNESALQIGDIVLTTTTDLLSQGIRTVTGSDISHMLVYVVSAQLTAPYRPEVNSVMLVST